MSMQNINLRDSLINAYNTGYDLFTTAANKGARAARLEEAGEVEKAAKAKVDAQFAQMSAGTLIQTTTDNATRIVEINDSANDKMARATAKVVA